MCTVQYKLHRHIIPTTACSQTTPSLAPLLLHFHAWETPSTGRGSCTRIFGPQEESEHDRQSLNLCHHEILRIRSSDARQSPLPPFCPKGQTYYESIYFVYERRGRGPGHKKHLNSSMLQWMQVQHCRLVWLPSSLPTPQVGWKLLGSG